ncbi:MAG: TetR family transcriptional regulator [Myxococcaceae bacterium]
MARPRKIDARDTRQAILDASLELFGRQGYFGTGVRAIASAAGVRESAVYHHFENKQAILHELLRDLGPGRAAMLGELDIETLARDLGGKELLRQLVQMVVELWATPQEMRIFRLMMSEGPRLSETGVIDHDALIGQALKRISRVFAELNRLGYTRKAEPEVQALAFMGPLIALRVRVMAMAKGGKPDLKKVKTLALAHVDYFWDGATKLNGRSVSAVRRKAS